MAKQAIKLDRVLRVRTLQLNLVRAEEVRAREQLQSELELRNRIRQLSAAVAPAPDATEAFSFIAAAHFRERLQQSETAAENRLRAAEHKVEVANGNTREARRDQNAIEKLIERDSALEALKAVRALQEAPPTRRNRHDPC